VVTRYGLEFINDFKSDYKCYDSSTTYTVTVTGSNGCTATSSVIVGVNNTPPTANAGTSSEFNVHNTFCNDRYNHCSREYVFVVASYRLEFNQYFKSIHHGNDFNNVYGNRYRKQRMYGNFKCVSGCK
jgi:hypothetical protein